MFLLPFARSASIIGVFFLFPIAEQDVALLEILRLREALWDFLGVKFPIVVDIGYPFTGVRDKTTHFSCRQKALSL